jgi:hypothetical protein
MHSIYVHTLPRTTYNVGEPFSTAGMIVKAGYNDFTTAIINNNSLSFNPSLSEALTLQHTAVRITFGTGNAARSTVLPIIVNDGGIGITINLDRNGGTGGTGSITLTPPALMPKSPAFVAPTRTNFIFDGYWTAATGGSRVINPNGTFVANVANYTNANGQWTRTATPTTLFARWEPITDGSPSIRVSSATGRAGETVTLQVMVSNSPPLSGFEFVIDYPESALKLRNVIIPDGMGFEAIIPSEFPSGTYLNFSTIGINAFIPNGIIMNIIFEIDNNAVPGSVHDITLSSFLALNENVVEVPFIPEPGRITVGNNIVYGNFTGSGSLNNADILWIRRYLSIAPSQRSIERMVEIWPTTITTFNVAAANFTNSGTVNNADILWIRRYLSIVPAQRSAL